MKNVILWVDASFDQNIGSFGWGAVFEVDGERKKIGKGGLYCANSTVAEALAIYQAISEVLEIFPNATIEVRSDCQSVVSLILGESYTSKRDLGQAIRLIKNLDLERISFTWIKGHDQGWDTKNKAYNKHADKFANELRKNKAS